MRRTATALFLGCVLGCSAPLRAAEPSLAPRIKPTAPAHLQTDKEIQEQVVKGLIANPEVLAAKVKVEVESGTVTLHGAVRSHGAKKMATKMTRAVPGVLRVDNRLLVLTR